MVDSTKAKKLSLVGAVIAAIAASSCCIGPLVVAMLGVGGAGAFAVLGAYRPHILVVTAALLGAGFYFTYRKPAPANGDACGCEKPKTNRIGRIGLWVATALVILFAAAPTVLAKVAARSSHPAVASSASVQSAELHVQGMDCEACAVHIRAELLKVGGFHDLKLDLGKQTILVSYEPSPGRLEAYAKAINDLGYEATLTIATTAAVAP